MLTRLFSKRDPNRDAFEAEVLPHMDVLYANALRLTRSTAEAEDLVQETVLRAYRFFERFERGSNVKAWLLRIQYNLFVNRYRRVGRDRDARESMIHEPSGRDMVSRTALRALTDADGVAMSSIVQRELVEALEALPEDHRTVVVLADIEELSYKEIAEVVGCPIGTVMSRLHRARRALREHLLRAAEGQAATGSPAPVVQAQPAATAEPQPVSLEAFRRDRRRS